ncbi:MULTISPECIES: hypothetical protein [unclassified Streptomyces]|uniref:hypothetical protein n=1 Tax=unclassified Streptomyces TaxID=2593676 RepID=UPI0037FC275A
MQGPAEGIHTVGEPEFEGGGGTAEDLFDGGADSLLARAGVPMMSRVLSTTGAGMKVSICARTSSQGSFDESDVLAEGGDALEWGGRGRAGEFVGDLGVAGPRQNGGGDVVGVDDRKADVAEGRRDGSAPDRGCSDVGMGGEPARMQEGPVGAGFHEDLLVGGEGLSAGYGVLTGGHSFGHSLGEEQDRG